MHLSTSGKCPKGCFRDSSKHPGNRELQPGIPDLWCTLDLVTPTALSSQVRSLTYDVINEPLHDPQMSQPYNALSARVTFTGRWDLQDLLSFRGLTTFISQIFPKCHIKSGWSRDLTYKSMGKYENCYFGARNDIQLSQVHGIVTSCTPCKIWCCIFALLTLHDVIYDVTRVIRVLGQ